jgi:hypothetical protein
MQESLTSNLLCRYWKISLIMALQDEGSQSSGPRLSSHHGFVGQAILIVGPSHLFLTSSLEERIPACF